MYSYSCTNIIRAANAFKLADKFPTPLVLIVTNILESFLVLCVPPPLLPGSDCEGPCWVAAYVTAGTQ